METQTIPLEGVLSWRTILGACLGAAWAKAYRRWRRAPRRLRAQCDGIKIGALLLRELDRDLRSPEVGFNLCVAEGTCALAKRVGRLACATHAFEYQPDGAWGYDTSPVRDIEEAVLFFRDAAGLPTPREAIR